MENTIIELTVNNHPGVMSHITGLIARRGFNLEGILCGTSDDSSKSIMFLLMRKNEMLDKIVGQLEKLEDVVSVETKDNYRHDIFHEPQRFLL